MCTDENLGKFAYPLLPGNASIPQIMLKHVPNGGIQPEVAVDSNGTVHLIYFKGNPSQGDLFDVNSKDGLNFSDPIRVNSVAGTAIAVGNIRGGRIAVLVGAEMCMSSATALQIRRTRTREKPHALQPLE